MMPPMLRGIIIIAIAITSDCNNYQVYDYDSAARIQFGSLKCFAYILQYSLAAEYGRQWLVTKGHLPNETTNRETKIMAHSPNFY